MQTQPTYSPKAIEAVRAIHKIAPNGVCRVKLEWNEKRGKWDKKPVAHWAPNSLQKPAHAHWPDLPKEVLEHWFENNPPLRGIGVSCYKFGMIGIDIDEGDPVELIEIIKRKCGATPLGRLATQRGYRLYYQAHDDDLRNRIVGWEMDGFQGKGEILLFTQYDYIWDPIATYNAIIANFAMLYKGPHLPLDIFRSTKQQKKQPESNRISSEIDDINAEQIASALNLTKHDVKENTWYGACPFCKHGETRFEVTQGHTRPLIRCWVCEADGTPENMNFIYNEVKRNLGLKQSFNDLVKIRKKEPNKEPKKPHEPPKKYDEELEESIVIRSETDTEGNETIYAFFNEEKVGEYIDGKWILCTRSDQKLWNAFLSFKVLNINIRMVRYGQYPQVSRDMGKTWAPLTDGLESKLWIEIERKVALENTKGISFVSPSADVKRLTINAFLENQYDPVKEWLDFLPEWDGVYRLNTHLEDCGMTIHSQSNLSTGTKVDFRESAQSYIPLEIVRLTYFPGAQRNPMPVFRGQGKEGKSSYGRRILPPHLQKQNLVTADYKLTMVEQKAGQLLAKSKICELREFGINRYSDMEEVKSNAFAETIDFRIPWGKRPITLQRHDVCYVTTNQGNLSGSDPALHRRFFYCSVTGKVKTVDRVAWTQFDQKIGDGAYTVRDQIFAEAKHRVMNSPNPMTYCELPDLENEEYMEHNMIMGGVYDTPGEDFQDTVNHTIELLIEKNSKILSMRDMKAAIVCVDHSKEILTASEIEAFSDTQMGAALTRAGAKEMVREITMHKNDKVKRAIKKNAELRVMKYGDTAKYFEWKKSGYKDDEKRRESPKFHVKSLKASLKYDTIRDAFIHLGENTFLPTLSQIAKHLGVSEEDIKSSDCWDRVEKELL